jgi:hypothetical protein
MKHSSHFEKHIGMYTLTCVYEQVVVVGPIDINELLAPSCGRGSHVSSKAPTLAYISTWCATRCFIVLLPVLACALVVVLAIACVLFPVLFVALKTLA